MDLDAWLAGLRAGEDAGARRRERWLEQQVSEEASFHGVLVDLAEHGRSVALETVAGSRPLELRGVGIDFCAGVDRGRWILLPLRTLAAVRPAGGGRESPGGSRAGAIDATLLEAMADLLGERPRLVVAVASGEQLVGELRSIGTDLLTLRGDGTPPRPIHVAAEHIVEILVS